MQDIAFKNNYIVMGWNIPHYRQVETTKTAASQPRVWHEVQDLAKVRRRTSHDLRHS